MLNLHYVINRPLRLVYDVRDAALQAEMETCEADVFTAWFGNTAQDLAREYGPYPHTHWLAVLDARDRVLGTTRLFLPSGVRTKTMDDISTAPWNADPERSLREAGLDPATTVDFATLAVRAEAAKADRQVSKALMYGWMAVVRANGCQGFTLITDVVPDRLARAIGLRFHTLPGTDWQPYFGSAASRPVYAHLDDLLDVQRRLSPQDYRLVALGEGFEHISVPPVDYFAVPRSGRERRPA